MRKTKTVSETATATTTSATNTTATTYNIVSANSKTLPTNILMIPFEFDHNYYFDCYLQLYPPFVEFYCL